MQLFNPRRDVPLLAILGVVVVALVGLVHYLLAGNGSLSVDDDLYRVCKDWTTKQLKSPATAVYPPLSALDTTEGYGIKKEVQPGFGEPVYKVSGYVDAQNSFGALLRSDFVCEVKQDGDQWRGRSTVSAQ